MQVRSSYIYIYIYVYRDASLNGIYDFVKFHIKKLCYTASGIITPIGAMIPEAG